jgi:undecaprenyl-diphosphatase
MDLAFAALLGVVQGITEFLPISSSAHLILARAFFGWDASVFGLAFDVAVHLGTLAATAFYFRRDLAEMAAAVRTPLADSEPARLLRLVAIGTAPIVVVGVLGADWIETHVRTPLVCAVTLAVGALLFLGIERWSSQRRGVSSLKAGEAVAFGIAQAAALVPGVSRSGATITMGMALGLRRDAAARFGFLLGIPAVVAAAGREGIALVARGFLPGEARVFVIGILTSGIVGYLTVKYLMRYLNAHRLDGFAWYRLALAAAVVVWLIVCGW